MTGEEKFTVDLEGYLVIKNVLTPDEVAEMNAIIIHGTMPWRAAHQRRSLLYKYSPGHSAWAGTYYDISKYGELTEQLKRMLLPPSIGRRPRVVDADG